MKHLRIHIGGNFNATEQRVLDVVGRLRHGEGVEPEEHLTFETWGSFSQTMTAGRVVILRHVAAHCPPSVGALAEAVGRDQAAVRDDVTALSRAELIRVSETRLSTDCDVDRTTLASA